MNWGIYRARAPDTSTHAETRERFCIGTIGELHRAVEDWLEEEIIGFEPDEGW